MGDVAVTIRVSLEDLKLIREVEAKIKAMERIAKIEEEDLGFGIKVLRVTAVVKDSEGQMDKLEDALREIEGVSEIDILGVDLI